MAKKYWWEEENQPPFGTIDFDNPYRYRPTK